MSGVKRYYAPGLDCMWRDPAIAPRECIPMVLASDYDALAADLAERIYQNSTMIAKENDDLHAELSAIEAERDTLRAQVEAMRALMAEARLMTFVANSGQSGVLRGQIDAALQAKP